MQIGDTIRKYRKDKNITQDEMAKRLGVTAPAVNKWENGNSFPDISLLSPIARLLNISVDTLLSHSKELSNEKANGLVEEGLNRLKTEPYDTVFNWMKQCIEEYPNSDFLILWMARVLDSQREKIPDKELYDSYILKCYKRVLESDIVSLKQSAAESIYYFYMNKEQYEQAEEYLAYFSQENPEKKQKLALIYSKTGRQEEAYKMYEELLYAGYQSLSMTFHQIYILALKENNFCKAHMLVEKSQLLAALFEYGEYHIISAGLQLATLEKNESETLHIMEEMLVNLDTIYDFTKSPLYEHMNFKAVDKGFLKEVREDLLKGFQNEQTYNYLKDNQQWKDLVKLKH